MVRAAEPAEYAISRCRWIDQSTFEVDCSPCFTPIRSRLSGGRAGAELHEPRPNELLPGLSTFTAPLPPIGTPGSGRLRAAIHNRQRLQLATSRIGSRAAPHHLHL